MNYYNNSSNQNYMVYVNNDSLNSKNNQHLLLPINQSENETNQKKNKQKQKQIHLNRNDEKTNIFDDQQLI